MSQEQNTPATQGPSVPKSARSQLPVGEVFKAAPDTWYKLKVNYTDSNGASQEGYLGPVDPTADPNRWATASWPEMLVGGGYTSKFKLHPRTDGWYDWEIDDGYYLSVHEYTERFFFRDNYD